MLRLEDLRILDDAVESGAPVVVTEEGLDVGNGTHVLPLRRKDLPRVCVDRCDLGKGIITCRGWALSDLSLAPVKRIHLLAGKRLFPQAAPVRRIDVRQIVGTNYDDTGFEFAAEVGRKVQRERTVQLVVVTSTGISVKTAGCTSNNDHLLRTGDVYESGDDHVTLSLDGGAPTAVRQAHFRATVDSFALEDDNLRVSGWIFANEASDRKLVVALGAGGHILTESVACDIARPDVRAAFDLPKGVDHHGFSILAPAAWAASIDRSEIEIVAATIDDAPPVAGIVPAFPVAADRSRLPRWRTWRSRKAT